MEENMREDEVKQTNSDLMNESVAEQEAVNAPVETVAETSDETVSETGKGGKWYEKFTNLLTKKVLIAIVAVVAVVGIGCGIGVAVASDSPVIKILKGAEATAKSAEKLPAAVAMEEVLNGGSILVKMNTEGISGGFLDMDVQAKLYTALESSKIAANASVSMDGKEFLDASIWVSEKEIIAASAALLEEAYGINLKDAEKNIKTSAVVELLGIDEETIESYLEQNKETKIDEELAQDIVADVEELAEKVIKKFAKSVKKNAETDKRKETLDFNGDKTKVQAVEITVDGKMLAQIVYDVAEYLKESGEVEKLVDKYAEYIIANFAEALGEIEEEDIIDAYQTALDDVLEAKEDIEEEFEDAKISVVGFLNSDYLVGLEFKMEDDSEEVEISVMAGPTLTDMKELRIEVKADGDKQTLVYAVDVNDRKEYSAALKVRDNGKVVTTGSIDWDKKEGGYKLKLEATDRWGDVETYAASGTLQEVKGTTELLVKKVTLEGIEYEPKITIVFDKSDKIPSKPEYTELLTMDEEDVLDLVEDIESEAMDLLTMFQ